MVGSGMPSKAYGGTPNDRDEVHCGAGVQVAKLLVTNCNNVGWTIL